MTDLGEWLAVQLDADAADHPDQVHRCEGGDFWTPGWGCDGPCKPARTIAAHRAILAEWQDPAQVDVLPDGVVDGRDPDERDRDVAVADAIDHAVRALASIYSDRPGFDPAWSTVRRG